jgi:dienelactone hydrolase
MTAWPRRVAAAAVVLALLPGCDKLVESVAESCPSDPAESGGIDWIPDVAHPVSFGFQDLGTAQGAPRTMRIYFPSHNTPFDDKRSILKLCVHRWPVVLFLHGQPPRPQASPVGYHLKWTEIPSVLAQSGYVVVVPNHDAPLPINDVTAIVTAAMNDVAFARTTWPESKWVDKRPTSTAVVGHSFGALLGARVAAAHPEIGAFVSLGGRFQDFDDRLESLQAITMPSLFMWGKGLIFEDLDGNPKLWDPLTQPKYAAVYNGQHFDYLPAASTGDEVRGPCGLIGGASASLAALFVSANVPVSVSRTKIPIELTKPKVDLTPKQQFYGNGALGALDDIQQVQACRIDLRWKLPAGTGSRKLGP